MDGYSVIPFAGFALGLCVVAIPALLLPERQANYYVVLVLVFLVVYNMDALDRLTAFIMGASSRGKVAKK